MGSAAPSGSAEALEARSGDSGGSGALADVVCCCASVLWMVVNFRCRRSTWRRGRVAGERQIRHHPMQRGPQGVFCR